MGGAYTAILVGALAFAVALAGPMAALKMLLFLALAVAIASVLLRRLP